MDEGVAVLVIILILLGVGAAVYYHHNNGWALPGGTRLVSEYNESGIVVLSQYITPSPGSVWQLVQAPSGLMFVETDSKLVEDIVMDNVTLAGGDVVAPHLYDWHVLQNDDVLDYILYNLPSPIPLPVTINTTFTVQYAGGDLPDGWHVYIDLYNKTNGVARAGRLGLQGWGTNNVELDVINATGYKHTVAIVPVSLGAHTITAHIEDGNYILTIDGQSTTSTTAYNDLLPYVQSVKITLGDVWTTGYATTVEYVELNNVVMDPTFTNGTAYFTANGGTGTVSGAVQRIPASRLWLYYFTNIASDGEVHFKFFPKGTIIEVRDTVTGATYKYTIDGVANPAGLIEDYAVTPPTNNTVTIIAHVPSERIRFKAPDGFTIRLIDSASGYEEELPVRDGTVTLAAGDKLELVAKAEEPLYLSISQDDLAYHITVKKNDGSTGDAYIWVYDPNGNLIDYGVAKDGTYTLAKSPDLPSGIRVKAVILDNGIYYHGEQTFKLAEEKQVTTTPAPQGLAAMLNNNPVVAVALAFIFAILAAVIIAALKS